MKPSPAPAVLPALLLLLLLHLHLCSLCSGTSSPEHTTVEQHRDAITGPTQFNILHYGAIADGTTLATTALATAVQLAHDAWRRRPPSSPARLVPAEVLVPNGTFVTGAFSLASGVALRLGKGAILRASTNVTDYPFKWWNWDPALVDTRNATLTGVVGEGTIDGQAPGPYWSTGFDAVKNYFIPRTWTGIGPSGGCRWGGYAVFITLSVATYVH